MVHITQNSVGAKVVSCPSQPGSSTASRQFNGVRAPRGSMEVARPLFCGLKRLGSGGWPYCLKVYIYISI